MDDPLPAWTMQVQSNGSKIGAFHKPIRATIFVEKLRANQTAGGENTTIPAGGQNLTDNGTSIAANNTNNSPVEGTPANEALGSSTIPNAGVHHDYAPHKYGKSKERWVDEFWKNAIILSVCLVSLVAIPLLLAAASNAYFARGVRNVRSCSTNMDDVDEDSDNV